MKKGWINSSRKLRAVYSQTKYNLLKNLSRNYDKNSNMFITDINKKGKEITRINKSYNSKLMRKNTKT